MYVPWCESRLLLPAKPKLLPTFALEAVDVHVLLSGRAKLEKAIKEFLRPTLQQPGDSGRPIQITARRLKSESAFSCDVFVSTLRATYSSFSCCSRHSQRAPRDRNVERGRARRGLRRR